MFLVTSRYNGIEQAEFVVTNPENAHISLATYLAETFKLSFDSSNLSYILCILASLWCHFNVVNIGTKHR